MKLIDKIKRAFSNVDKMQLIVPGTIGVVVAALLLNLGLTNFSVKGYLYDEGYAVPQDKLYAALNNDSILESIALVPVSAGDVIYTRAMGGKDYYVGESKTPVSSSYPVFARNGQVLYFIDDSIALVTSDWDVLGTYDGLSLTNGITFNTDNSRADIAEILLAKVSGGYIAAREINLYNNVASGRIPMNSVCDFTEDRILYFSYDDGMLTGHYLSVPLNANISVGDHEYTYLDFLKKLGLWTEKYERVQNGEEIPPEDPAEEILPEETEDPSGTETGTNTGHNGHTGGTNQNSETISELVSETESGMGEESPASGETTGHEYNPADQPDREPKAPEQPQKSSVTPQAPPAIPASGGSSSSGGGGGGSAPSDVFQQPGPAIFNPDEVPADPVPPAEVESPDPEWKEPTVSFGPLSSWVYTVDTDAVVEDPARVIQGGGVSLTVYKIDNGKETQVLRRVVNSSGTISLGQLPPDGEYHVAASYEYKDILGYRKKVELDLGKTGTKSFSELGTVSIELRDYLDNFAPSDAVQLYSTRVQVRDFVFPGVENGSAPVEVGGVKTYPAADPHSPETYINTLSLAFKGAEPLKFDQVINVDSSALNLLRLGFTLSHWETQAVLKSGGEYNFTISASDRYGNAFTIETNKDTYYGRTSKLEPYVNIIVPQNDNHAGSILFETTFSNPDGALISANPGTDSSTVQVLGPDTKAALYIVPAGAEITPENAVSLNAYQLDASKVKHEVADVRFLPVGIAENGSASVKTEWTITNLPVMQSYNAVVLCGCYDIGDGLFHFDENLENTTNFLTSSMSNMGTIPFTNNDAENLSNNSADLKLRMIYNENEKYFNALLLPMLRELEFGFRTSTGAEAGSFRWLASELKEISLGLPADLSSLKNGDLYEKTVTIPVYIGEEKQARTMDLNLYWSETVPELNGSSVSNVWDFILATSNCSQTCWFEVKLGSELSALPGEEAPARLIDLQSRTTYVGEIKAMAGVDGAPLENMTGRNTKEIRFTTRSHDAEVVFSDVFISSDFAEFFDLSFDDPDSCILADAAGRGGDNIRMLVRNSSGITVNAAFTTVDAETDEESTGNYVNSTKTYSKLRIGGLKQGETYTLSFVASKYENAGTIAVNSPLRFNALVNMQDAPADLDVTAYTIIPGSSVVGDVELMNVSQMYTLGNGEITSDISIIGDDEYYTGVWRNTYYTYYNGHEVPNEEYDPEKAAAATEENPYTVPQYITDIPRSRLIEEMKWRETDLIKDGNSAVLEKLVSAGEVYSASANPIAIKDNGATANMDSYWSTRYIHVEPGDEFAIFNTSAITGFRITFYYLTTSGQLVYYNNYSNTNFYMGQIFRVPDLLFTKGAQPGYAYMTISGYTSRGRTGMIIEKYNKDLRGEDILHDGDSLAYPIKLGSHLDTAGSLVLSATYGYTPDFIPISGGSIYYIQGRDSRYINIDDAKDNKTNATTNCNISFYNEAHAFICSQAVGSQSALVKAPFGSAYCRLDVLLTTDAGGTTYTFSNNANLSLQLYTGAEQERFIGDFRYSLKDSSNPSIMGEAGEYTLTLMMTNGTVSDTEDLSAWKNWSVLWAQTQAYTEPKEGIEFRREGLPANRGYKLVLSVKPDGWKSSVTLDNEYFTTNSVIHVVSNYAELLNMRNDPAGAYIVTNDITIKTLILDSDRPFSGTIDFQGHTINCETVYGLFHTISTSGVVKNLNIVNTYNNDTRTAVLQSYGTVAYKNYGVMQNVIAHYGPRFDFAPVEFGSNGIICTYNYGVIDGFVVELLRDLRVSNNVGGVCYVNYGEICNGYFCSARLADRTNARFIHNYTWQGESVTSNAQYIGYIAGSNNSRGKIHNVFAVGDLFIGSADKNSGAGGGYDGVLAKETSTTNTNLTGLLVGANAGQFDGGFSVGDRYDFEGEDTRVSSTRRVAASRGPAISHVSGQYSVENLTYFSTMGVKYLTSPLQDNSSATQNVNVAEYNRMGEMKSLFDWQWYEGALGADGDRFDIRYNIETTTGYFPRLILPACFTANQETDVQPLVPLPGSAGNQIELTSSEVKAQNYNTALVTLTLRNKYGLELTGFDVFDHYGYKLNCEVIDQYAAGEDYRVDVIISLGNNGAMAESEYTIEAWKAKDTSGYFSLESDEKRIEVDFWKQITSLEDWAAMIAQGAPIRGNYWVVNDLDFSSSSYTAWYCSKKFYGKIDGGIYETKEVELFTSSGEPIFGADGKQRTIEVRTKLSGRAVISGVGNLDNAGKPGRSNANYCGSLFTNFYGEMSNLIFDNFVCDTDATGKENKAVNSNYCGVVTIAQSGSKFENCHVQNSLFNSNTYAGSLLGYGVGVSIVDCSVADSVKVQTVRFNRVNNTVYVGGLVGYLSGGLIQNSFSGAVVSVPDVYLSNGNGGLLGYGTSVIIESCYSYGSVDANVPRVGGICGQLTGSSYLSGCWSTASVRTIGDFAGGIVGLHSDGVLSNNYTSSTVLTRSLSAVSVHRICNNTAYSQTNRFDNYAFAGQYMTYFDKSQATNPYQFGIWDDLDGATSLLNEEEVCDPGVWSNIIQIGEGYDLSTLSRNVMPKLYRKDTDAYLDFQPDVKTGYDSQAMLKVINVEAPNQGVIRATLALINGGWVDNDLASTPIEDLADWTGMSCVGATVSSPEDMGIFSGVGFNGETGREFKISLNYTDPAVGHYLDSYVVSLNVYREKGSTATELVQAQISIPGMDAVYKEIPDMATWNAFFNDPQHALAFENVMLTGNEYVFNNDSTVGVRVNRLCGRSATAAASAWITGSVTKSQASLSIVANATTMINNVNFHDFTLSNTLTSAHSYSGIVGICQGDIEDCIFNNVTLSLGRASYAGIVGQLYGTASDLAATNLKLTTNNTTTTTNNYVGGLVGYATTSSTVKDCKVCGSEDSPTVITTGNTDYVGGAIGDTVGQVRSLTVTDTQVHGRKYVGGAIGYVADGNAGRESEYRLEGITVGTARSEDGTVSYPTNESAVPGLLKDTSGGLAPNVTVSADTYTTGTGQYVGGVAGYIYPAAAVTSRDLFVYNTEVYLPMAPGDPASYSSYAGGVCGYYSNYIRDSVAENCIVENYYPYSGGISGVGTGTNNTAKECVIVGLSDYATALGGNVGYGGPRRGVAQHCVVIGKSLVGGAVGGCSYSSTYTKYMSTAIDCVVLGDEAVGGFVGGDRYTTYSCAVIASNDQNGNPTIATTIDSSMFPHGSSNSAYGRYVKDAGTTYTGTWVQGDHHVGGIVGEMDGLSVHDSYAGSNVTVKGRYDVGGVVGRFYGWHDSYGPTGARSLYRCASGATVTADTRNAGGIIGFYTRNDCTTKTAPTVASVKGPNAGSFYGNLFTGSVTCTAAASAGPLIGAMDTWEGLTGAAAATHITNVLYDGTQMAYSRVYEKSMINGVEASTLMDGNVPLHRIGQYYKDSANKVVYYSNHLLAVSAEELADSNTYFQTKSTANAYNGMGWTLTEWYDTNKQLMFGAAGRTTAAAAPDFATYKEGIEGDGLVLWLDARNNTGKGYTDNTVGLSTTQQYWKDLSGKGNDAQLYFNNKLFGGEDALSLTEARNYMRWDNGALESITTSSSKGYYALLNESIAKYINGTAESQNGKQSFTIELVYTLTEPRYPSLRGILSWRDPARDVYGGFQTKFSSTTGNQATFYAYKNSEATAASAWYITPVSGANLQQPLYSTSTYVVDADGVTNKNNRGTAKNRYYVGGSQVGYYDTAFTGYVPEDSEWRVNAYGVSGNCFVRLYGVRVYDHALTDDEIAKNAEYDKWYYCGGTKPEGLTATVTTGLVWGTPNSQLFCSEDYGYNGTLISASYSGDGSDLGRGYWYLRSGSDGSYTYSEIKAKNGLVYLPQLRMTVMGNEVYGGTLINGQNCEFVLGQEGEMSNGQLYSCEDGIISGGYILSKTLGGVSRTFGDISSVEYVPPVASAPVRSMLSARAMQAKTLVTLPGMTVYSSGIETVNIELDRSAPAGLTYEILDGSGSRRLSGVWPEGERTLTMNWDYCSDFTVTLKLGEESASRSCGSSDLARSVMTYGDSWWYLYGSECLNSSNRSVCGGSPVFIHLSDGMALDDEGNVYDLRSEKKVGKIGSDVMPFTLAGTRPLWSGKLMIDGAAAKETVMTFGTYTETSGGTKNTVIFAKGDHVFTLPVSGNAIGSFICDSYNENYYNTVLGTDGILTDFGNSPVYPENFSNSGIRETSDNIGYNGHVVLVRYRSGLLVAFDYLTGEVLPSVSNESDISFFDFFTEGLQQLGFSRKSLLSGGASQALRAVEYQSEVDSDPSLRTALVNLNINEGADSAVDGTGEGIVSAFVPGGLDGEIQNAGLDEGDTPSVEGMYEPGTAYGEGETVVDGIAALGEAVQSGNAGDPNNAGTEVGSSEGAGLPTTGIVGEPTAEGLETAAGEGAAVEGTSVIADAGTEGTLPEDGRITAEAGAELATGSEVVDVIVGGSDSAGNESVDEPEDQQPFDIDEDAVPRIEFANGFYEPAFVPEEASGAAAAEPTLTAENIVRTRYVQVFDTESGSGEVFELAELLVQPEEELVSQEIVAEKLEEMGFRTALVSRTAPVKETANGLFLIILTGFASVLLLVAMGLLKNRKLDKKQEPNEDRQ